MFREQISRSEALWAVQWWANILTSIDRDSVWTSTLPALLRDEVRNTMRYEVHSTMRRLRRDVVWQGVAELMASPFGAFFDSRALAFYVMLAATLGSIFLWLCTGSPVNLDFMMTKDNFLAWWVVLLIVSWIFLVGRSLYRLRRRLAETKQRKILQQIPQPGWFAPHIGDLQAHEDAADDPSEE